MDKRATTSASYQQTPKSWEFRISSSKSAYDAGTYDVLHSVNNNEWIRHDFGNFTADDRKDLSRGAYINTTNKYRYYAIYISANHGSTIITITEFSVYGKSTGVSPKYKLLNWGDLRLGDMEISEYKGKAYENLNQTDNYIEMVYTPHRPIQMFKYALYPNNLDATNTSNQNGFSVFKELEVLWF